jgi:hypothetical protein
VGPGKGGGFLRLILLVELLEELCEENPLLEDGGVLRFELLEVGKLMEALE